MIKKIKNWFNSLSKTNEPIERITPSLSVVQPIKKTAREIADDQNLPYISILSVELDPDNIGNGSFELDWNDKFIVNLVKAGYVGKTDQQMVDQWFQDICRNIITETFEQEMADPDRRRSMIKRDLGSGRTEIS